MNFIKNLFFHQPEEESEPVEEENTSIAENSVDSADPLLQSAIKVEDSNRSEISMAKIKEEANCTTNTITTKDPLESTMSASMSGIGILEDSNESEMAENLLVSDNEGEFLFCFCCSLF